jgi:hypothetical protein
MGNYRKERGDRRRAGERFLPYFLFSPLSCSIRGFTANRGEQFFTIPNIPHAIQQVFSRKLIALPWNQVVLASRFKKPPHKPRARFNAAAFAARRQGFRTIGEVCAASGVPDSTLCDWEGIRIPRMQRINGIRAVPADEFDSFVQRCRECASYPNTPYRKKGTMRI